MHQYKPNSHTHTHTHVRSHKTLVLFLHLPCKCLNVCLSFALVVCPFIFLCVCWCVAFADFLLLHFNEVLSQILNLFSDGQSVLSQKIYFYATIHLLYFKSSTKVYFSLSHKWFIYWAAYPRISAFFSSCNLFPVFFTVNHANLNASKFKLTFYLVKLVVVVVVLSFAFLS